jgi:bacteriocin-like protein
MKQQDTPGRDRTIPAPDDELSDDELNEITGGTQRPPPPEPARGSGGVPMPFPLTPRAPLPPLNDPHLDTD